jgi:hypothetical protein
MKRGALTLVSLLLTAVMVTSCIAQPQTSETPPGTHSSSPTEPQHATSTPQQSPTRSPSRTPTLAPTATWTPLPTLDPEQAGNQVRQLLMNNGGCQLPCWWGIVPGRTPLQEAIHFLAPFSEIAQGGKSSYYENGKQHLTTGFDVSYSVPGQKETSRMLLGVLDDQVAALTVFPPGSEQHYKLPQLLAALGAPKQIFVSAQAESQTAGLLPAFVILDYSSLGILAVYQFPLFRVGDNLRICPNSVGPRLDLWPAGVTYRNQLSTDQYVSLVTGFDPRQLQDVSNMDIASFVETFQNPSSSACLETPASIWP